MKKYFVILAIAIPLIGLLSNCKKDEDEEDKEVLSNLTTNSDFANGLQDWEVRLVFNGTVSTYDDNGNACVQMYHPAVSDWCALGQEVRSKLEVGKSYLCSFRYKVLSGTNVKLIFRMGCDDMAGCGYNLAGGSSELVIDNEWHTISANFTESESISADYQQIAIYFDYNCTDADGTVLIDDIEMIEVE